MADSKKRIALKPHMKEIKEWVDAGKTDEWIADALGTSASSVQSFRSRNDIYRRDRGHREPESVFEGVLDHGERDGWGLWLDPSVADDPIWKGHWAGVESVTVKVAEDSIVLEPDFGSSTASEVTSAQSLQVPLVAPVAGADDTRHEETPPVESSSESVSRTDGTAGEAVVDNNGAEREQGRVKWFDPEKGYGFLVRPGGEDLFVHHSEVQGNPAALEPGGDVEYEVGKNDRGPNARQVRLAE
ncbi:MAG: cold-shock protein [Rubrobacteraceae bacterium]